MKDRVERRSARAADPLRLELTKLIWEMGDDEFIALVEAIAPHIDRPRRDAEGLRKPA